MSKNCLYSLPDNIGDLLDLQTLDLNSNRLENIPSSITQLSNLTILNLSSNRIDEIPSDFCNLTELRVLSLQRNRIVRLPLLGTLPNIAELKVGYNQIEVLSEELFSHPKGIAGTMTYFECCENNLQELPSSVSNINPVCRFEATSNPLISPPQEILKDGLKAVQEYLRVRVLRTREIWDLLWNQDFEVAFERTHPVASDGESRVE